MRRLRATVVIEYLIDADDYDQLPSRLIAEEDLDAIEHNPLKLMDLIEIAEEVTYEVTTVETP